MMSITELRRSKYGVVAVASLAVFIDMVAYGVLLPIMPRLLMVSGVRQEDTDRYQTYLSGVYALGLFLATPTFGIISDKLQNRRIPMLFGLIALIISTVTFAFVRQVHLLIIARLCQGIAAAATWVVGFAMLSDTFPPNQGLGMILGLVMSFHTAGSLAGPLIGGFMGEYFGLQYPFLFCAALTLLDLAGRFFIDPPPPSASSKSPTKPGDSVGFKELILHRDILVSILLISVISSSFTSIEVLFPAWLQRSPWNFTESKSSLIMLAVIIPNAFISIFVGWICDRISRVWVLAAGLILHGLAAPLPTLATSTWNLVIYSVIFGCTSPLIASPLSPHMASVVERLGGTAYARVYALSNMSWSFGMMFGPWIVNLIKTRFTFSWAMCLITVWAFASLPILYFFSSSEAKARPVRHEEEGSGKKGNNNESILPTFTDSSTHLIEENQSNCK